VFKVDTKLVQKLVQILAQIPVGKLFLSNAQLECQKRTLLRACAQNQKILEYAAGTKYLVMQLFVHLKASKQLTQPYTARFKRLTQLSQTHCIARMRAKSN